MDIVSRVDAVKDSADGLMTSGKKTLKILFSKTAIGSCMTVLYYLLKNCAENPMFSNPGSFLLGKNRKFPVFFITKFPVSKPYKKFIHLFLYIVVLKTLKMYFTSHLNTRSNYHNCLN